MFSQKPTAGSNRLTRRAKAVRLAVAAGVIGSSIGIAFAVDDAMKPLTLQTILPSDTEAVASADLPWWWTATESIRQQPEIAKSITQFEQQSGLSFANDIQPWLGEASIAVLHASDKNPQFVLCAQVKDADAFKRFYTALQTHQHDKGMPTWTTSTYDGVELQGTVISEDATHKMPVKIGMVKDWVIAGFGAQTEEKVLDTATGGKASLADNPTWNSAMSHLPAQHVAWAGFDSYGLTKDMSAMPDAKIPAAQLKQAEAYRSVSTSSLTDTGDGFRMDSVAYPASEEARRQFAALIPNAPVTGGVFAHLPNHANAIYAIANPALWTQRMISIIRLTMTTPKEKNEFDHNLKQLAPYTDVVSQFTGEAALGLTWQDGIGVIATAHAASPAAAQRAARVMANVVRQQKTKVKQYGNIWKPVVGAGAPVGFFDPCWTVNGDWLTISSTVALTRVSTGTPTLTLPAESQGANFVAIGNFKGLTAVVSPFLQMASSPDSPPMLEILQGLELEPVTWSSWSTYHQTEGWTQSTGIISNWKWRDAVANEIKIVNRYVTKPKGSTKPAS